MKKTLLIIAMLAAAATAFAQGEKIALPFTRICQNPAAQAMGGASLASTSAQGFFANPAMLTFTDTKGDFSLGWQGWKPDSTNYMDFSGAMLFKQRFSLTLGASYGLGRPYDSATSMEMEPEPFRPHDLIIGGGVGIKMGKAFAMGANLRYAGQKLSKTASLGTVSADILMSAHVKDYSFTLGVINLGGKVSTEKNASTKFGIPASIDLGFGWCRDFADIHKVEVLADAGYYFHNEFNMSLGASYTLMDLVSFRAGFHYGQLIPTHASLGAGFSWKGLRLDLAYIMAGKENPVGNTAALSLGYRF